MFFFPRPAFTLGRLCVVAAMASHCASPSSDAISALPLSPLSYLEADDAAVIADGNDSKTIRAVARDAQGAPLVGYSIALYSDDEGVSFVQPAVTDANGVTQGSIRSHTPGHKWVQALLANENSAQAFGHGLSVVFSADTNSMGPGTSPPSPGQSFYLYTDSINVIADGNDVLTLTVAGRLRPGQSVTVTSDNPNDSLSPSTGTLNVNGLFQSRLRSTQAGSRTFTATAGSLQRSLSAALLPGAPDANHCGVILSPNTAVADGMASVSLYATIADAYNNTIAYETVSYLADSPNVSFGSNAGMTDGTGVFSVDMRSTVACAANATVTVGLSPNRVTLVARPLFISGPVDATHSAFDAHTPSVTMGQSLPLTLKVADAFGNAVGNNTIHFRAGSPNDTFVPATTTTDGNGVAQTLFTPAVAGTRRVTADATAANVSADVAVHLSNASVQGSTLVASPNGVVADGVANSNITLTMLDANQVPVVGQAVTFSALDANIQLAPSSGVTDSQGVLKTSAASATAGASLVEATSPNATLAVDLFFESH